MIFWYFIKDNICKKSNNLGDAILCAERHIGDEPFAVLLGDTITKAKAPCTKQLIDTFNRYEKSTLSLKVISNDKLNKYGIVEGSQVESNIYKISSLVEKPKTGDASSNLAIVGRYILTPAFLTRSVKQSRVSTV